MSAADTLSPTETLAESVASLSGAEIRKVWTPTESFLKRLNGAQLDAIMVEIDGTALPACFQRLKKSEKVARLHSIFANAPGLPPLTKAQRARAAAWTPDCMEIAPADKPSKPRRKSKVA
ncbi:MAG: hypothetical protein AAF565_05515 [Pseudomonadota bacterium]